MQQQIQHVNPAKEGVIPRPCLLPDAKIILTALCQKWFLLSLATDSKTIFVAVSMLTASTSLQNTHLNNMTNNCNITNALLFLSHSYLQIPKSTSFYPLIPKTLEGLNVRDFCIVALHDIEFKLGKNYVIFIVCFELYINRRWDVQI